MKHAIACKREYFARFLVLVDGQKCQFLGIFALLSLFILEMEPSVKLLQKPPGRLRTGPDWGQDSKTRGGCSQELRLANLKAVK